MKTDCDPHPVRCRLSGNPSGRQPHLWRVLAVIAVVAGSPLLHADPLAEARARYSEGQYEQAAKLYEQALESSAPSAAGFFELGRCLRQTGQDSRAALNFRRALVLDPRFAPAAAALAETNTDLGIPKSVMPWNAQVLERVPMDALAVSGTVLAWAGLFLLAPLLLFPRRGRGGLLAAGAFSLVAGAALVTLVWICDPRITDRNLAMVLTSGGTALLKAPADQSEKIASIPDGGTVQILSQRGRWFYGRLPSGQTGWFLTEGIVPVIPPA